MTEKKQTSPTTPADKKTVAAASEASPKEQSNTNKAKQTNGKGRNTSAKNQSASAKPNNSRPSSPSSAAKKTESKTDTPDNKAKPAVKPSEQPPAASEKPAKTSKTGTILGLTAIVIALGLSGGLYYQGQQVIAQQQASMAALQTELNNQLQAQQQANQQQVSQLNTTFSGLESKLTTELTQAQQTVGEVSGHTQVVSDQLASLQRTVADLNIRHPNEWMLAEAEYLVRIAGRKLWLEHDISSTVGLLKAADLRVTELNDPSLLPLRKAIANDIATLNALPQLDREGLVLQLSGLTNQVDALIIAGLKPRELTGLADTELTKDVSDWRDNLKKTWHTFADNFITVHRREGGVEALMSPEESLYLQENMKSKLLQAQLAVYREQQALYDDSLATALSWLEQYYDPNDSVTQSLKQAIQAMQRVKIEFAYPAQLSTQPTLEAVIEKRVKKALNLAN